MKILYVTTVSGTMDFFPEHIKMLLQEGHSVEIATSCSVKPINPLYNELGCKVYDIPFSRSPFSADNLKAYKMLKHLVEAECYDIVHTHTPNASMIARLACRNVRKKGTKVIYTAHGFHFFKGAPLKNWLMYYPVEKFCARYTDVLITINKEDYELAQKKIHAKKVCYVPGVGIDLEAIKSVQANRNDIRKAIGVPEDCLLLLSIGELNVNKNHQVVLKAFAELSNKNTHYAIAGIGDQKDNLLNLAKELGVESRFHLLGYRADALNLYRVADVFVFPSFREGLSVSMMEAMASGLPIICSKIRGNVDLVQNEKGALYFSPGDVKTLLDPLEKMIDDEKSRKQFGLYNMIAIERFGLQKILGNIKEIYK